MSLHIVNGDESITIRKISNGWIIKHEWEEKVEKDKYTDTEYNDEKFAFSTLDEALAKIKELAESIE